MNPDNFYLNDVSGSKWTLTHQANILYLPCVDPNILYLPCVDPNRQTFSTCHVLTPTFYKQTFSTCHVLTPTGKKNTGKTAVKSVS